MDRTVELSRPMELQPPSPTVEEVRRMIAQARDHAADVPRPINIHINLGDGDIRSRGRHQGTFRLLGSKLVWVVVAMSLSMGVAYARTRYVCQSFKDSGKFFYGMGVDRCVSVLIKQPFDQISKQLDAVNRSY